MYICYIISCTPNTYIHSLVCLPYMYILYYYVHTYSYCINTSHGSPLITIIIIIILRSHERGCYSPLRSSARIIIIIIIIIFFSAEWKKPRRSRTRRAIKTSDWITEDVNYRARSGNRRRPACNLRRRSIALSQSIYYYFIILLLCICAQSHRYIITV